MIAFDPAVLDNFFYIVSFLERDEPVKSPQDGFFRAIIYAPIAKQAVRPEFNLFPCNRYIPLRA
jgi:hypothetical protein